MDTRVNGHVLPDLLVRLLDSGLWCRPQNIANVPLLNCFSRPEELQFLSLNGTSKETDAFMRISKKLGKHYGLAKRESGLSNDGRLSAEELVVIAMNFEEEGLALVYQDKLLPSIYAGYIEENFDHFRWKKVCDTFDEFWSKLQDAGSGSTSS